jgi:ABC-type multidrug transport system fused ATPase/permease subunit
VAEETAEPAYTIYALHGADAPRSTRELPRLISAALRIVWAAGRREATLALALQTVAGLGTGAMVLVGQRVLSGVLDADRSGSGVGGFLPAAAALAVLTAALGIVAAVRREQEEMLAELTARYVQSQILDITCAVELAAFDEPAFHDRVARAQASVGRAPMVVFGLATVGMSLAGAAGSVLALLALEPVLAPLAALVIVPAGLLTSQRGEAFYRFAFAMTPRDRERGYLASLLTGRDPAKEVRAFQLVGTLRARHDRRYDERLAELRRVVRRQTRFALLANLAGLANRGERRRDAFAVTARDVALTYPGSDRPALHGVTMTIEPGQVVALVGENGSGKTTLAKLLGALYRPTRGAVLWDGRSTADGDLGELRRDAAVIFQEFIRYSLPARENIALGDHPRAGDVDGIRAAAIRTGAHDDLVRLPGGYDTMLGPAFEAASVRSADRIFVLHDGRLVESGTHDELVADGARYAELFELQAAAYR